MKFDDLLRDIGQFGPYQKRVCLLCSLPAILTSFEVMSSVFIFNIPPHRCAIPNFPNDRYHVINDTHLRILNYTIPREEDGKWSRCHVYSDVNSDVITANQSDVTAGEMESPGPDNITKCNKWVYDHSVFESTIPTEFDVVCDRSMYRATSNMVAEVGALTGILMNGFLADRFGRKVPFYVGALALLGGGFGIAFCTSFVTINMCRLIIGIARSGMFMNGVVLGMETVGPSRRVLAGTVIEVMWCGGSLILLLLAYLIRNWRFLEIAVSVPSVFLLAYWWLIPESPRWLAAKGRKEEALKVLERIAASNGSTLPKVDDVTELLEAEHKLHFRHVFRSRELVVRVVVLYSNMFAVVVIYYALLYNIVNLSGNIFLNYLMNTTVVETVGLCSPYFLLDRFGRKKVYFNSVFWGGVFCVSCILPALLEGPDWIIVALAVLGRLFVSCAFSTVFIYGAELFPTIIRTSVMGVGTFVYRTGGLVAPYIADVGILVGGRLEKALPLIVMGTPAVIVALLSLRLPETRGTCMPETLQDIQPSKGGCFSGNKNSDSDSNDKADDANIKMTSTSC